MPSTESQLPEQGCLVPPGNQTGIYYIVVAGLPWNTSWQSLKDFAKRVSDGTQLNIDYAMVYPGSTDGWVRVVGLKPFRKVLARLDGGAFNNRNLIADGRNETQYLNLRAMKPAQLQKPSTQQTCQSSHPSRPPTPSYSYDSPPQSPCYYAPSPATSYYFDPQSPPTQWNYTPHPSPVFLPVQFVPYILSPTFTLDTSMPPPPTHRRFKQRTPTYPARPSKGRYTCPNPPHDTTYVQYYANSQRSGSVSSSSTYTLLSSATESVTSLEDSRMALCVTPPPRAARTPGVVDGSCAGMRVDLGV